MNFCILRKQLIGFFQAIYNVTATQYPQACMQNQNDSIYVSPGALLTLTRLCKLNLRNRYMFNINHV